MTPGPDDALANATDERRAQRAATPEAPSFVVVTRHSVMLPAELQHSVSRKRDQSFVIDKPVRVGCDMIDMAEIIGLVTKARVGRLVNARKALELECT